MELMNVLAIWDGAVDAIGKVLIDGVRSILFFFDQIVYSLIPTLYKLIVSLANVDFYTGNAAIAALMNRVYILVGVFMLFRLAFSVIQYIIDPNAFSDESKGITNLVKRVLIAMVLLVTIPLIFERIYDVQGKILNSNIISNLILGTSSDGVTDMEEAAKDIQFLIFSPFFTINYEASSLSQCEPKEPYNMANVFGTDHMLIAPNGKQDDTSCVYAVANAMDNDSVVVASKVKITDFFGQDKNFKAFGGIVNMMADEQYAVNYTPIISTIVGGYMTFLLLSFCIDIAARAIKLMFLQILSPIAVIASVDPTASSQNDRLKEWGKECLTTFLSLFLRLAVIYVVIQMIKVITSKIFVENSTLFYEEFTPDKSLNLFVYIFLVFGAFQAAKSVPDLIEKALGIKMSGELNLNPFKTLGENKAFMGATGLATGLTAGVGAGALAGFTTSRDMNRGVVRSLFSGLGGAVTGGLGGSVGGFRAKGIRGASAGSQVGGRISRRMEVRESTGGVRGMPAMFIERTRRSVGMQTEYETMENNAKKYDDVKNGVSEMKKRIIEELEKGDTEWTIIQAQRKQAEKDLEDGKLTAAQYAAWQDNFHQQEEQRIQKYNDESVSGINVDADLEALRISVRKAMMDAHMQGDVRSWVSLGQAKDQANTSALQIRTDPKYNDAKDRSDAIKLTEHDSFFGGRGRSD